jgi:sterol desaturase/sphingolipid hydroxylase (fatty acid hydroxylase superfamily)
MNAESSLKPALDLKQRLFFRFAHPWGPTLTFGPLALFFIFLSLDLQARSLVSISLFLVGGLLGWTVIEYVLHRFIFHLVQVKEPWRTIASGLHMAHHRDTEMKDLIIAPPLVSLIFSIPIFLLLLAFTWNVSTALLLHGGILLGYIGYEWCHYGAHQYNPKFSVTRYLKRYHLQHHFKHPNGSFGVTTPMWDYVFGSSYKPKARG